MMGTFLHHYLVLSLLFHLVHVQEHCHVNENNILIYRICPLNNTPSISTAHVQENPPVTLNKNVSLVYNSFYHFLMTPSMDTPPTMNETHTLPLANVSNITITPQSQSESSKELKPKTNSFNFAAFDSGAAVLASTQGIQSAKSILLNRKEKYMMMPCDLEDKWFIIQLSEDIVMDRMEIMNLEHYSSNLKDIRIYARTQNDNKDDDNEENDINAQDNWFILQHITLQNKNRNSIALDDNHWVRALKIEILSYYGNEYYCTMTQIKVFGSTMLPHWKNELLSHLDEVEALKSNITKNATSSVNKSTDNHPQIKNDKQNHDKTESKTTNKRQSVFTILTKRITSLELNLTKQQMQVTRLVDLVNEFKDLDQRFNQYQVNLTNHMLYQSYGISMMLKSIQEEEDSNDHKKEKNRTDKMDDIPYSYFDDVQSWKRHETLERIENYMETLLFMMGNLYWIGLLIVVVQIIMAICLAFYVFECCGRRKGKNHTRKANSTKHNKVPPAPQTNPVVRSKKFIFAKALRSQSTRSVRTPRRQSTNTTSLIKRKNRKKIKKIASKCQCVI
eukprot:1157556_1